MSCIDWVATLRSASFRGVPFYVEHDDSEHGRRVVVHEFPNRDAPFTEDLGRKSRSYKVAAYVVGDDVLSRKSALVAACEKRGVGALVLPTDGPQQVRCKSCKRAHALDKLGLIGFDLDFVEAGTGLDAFPIGLAEALVESAVSAALPSVAAEFLDGFNTFRVDPSVTANATSQIAGFASSLDAARLSSSLTSLGGAAVLGSASALVRDASTLAIDGRDTVALSQTRLGLASFVGSGAVVTRAYAAAESLRTAATSDLAAASSLYTLLGAQ